MLWKQRISSRPSSSSFQMYAQNFKCIFSAISSQAGLTTDQSVCFLSPQGSLMLFYHARIELLKGNVEEVIHRGGSNLGSCLSGGVVSYSFNRSKFSYMHQIEMQTKYVIRTPQFNFMCVSYSTQITNTVYYLHIKYVRQLGVEYTEYKWALLKEFQKVYPFLYCILTLKSLPCIRYNFTVLHILLIKGNYSLILLKKTTVGLFI